MFRRNVFPYSLYLVFLYLLVQLCSVECSMNEVPSLNFFALGDWGGLPISPYTTPVEKAVAQEMGKLADLLNPEFVLGLGDNFYFLGVENVNDKRFQETFEDIFTSSSLNIPWYFCAGNHDHHGNVSAEIDYSKKSDRWNFPDFNYSKTWRIPDSSSTVQLVMIDTVILCGNTRLGRVGDQPHGTDFPKQADQQWAWIEKTLADSKADYLLVGGHYPVWSIAEHGPTQCLVKSLKPLLEKYNVTSYISGHDHNLQHLDDGSGVQYIVTGCANFMDPSNAHADDVPKGSSKFFWADFLKLGGFTTFSATPEVMGVTYVDSTGASLYSLTLKPRKEQ